MLATANIARLDGSGGALNKHPGMRAVDACCITIQCDPQVDGKVLGKATMHRKVATL